MAFVNVRVISTEMIKPSSPTTNYHNLSFIDQIQPPTYIPLIFFFQNKSNLKTNRPEICRSLKQSLSHILTIFYPLAGRIHGTSSVDCNDEGAQFIEAQVNSRLEEVIKDPKMEELEQFLPFKAYGLEKMTLLLSVKVSFFDCGGIALAVCLSHDIADGTSLMTFINAWSVANRNFEKFDHELVNHPTFDLAVHFPPMELSGSRINPITRIPKERIITKRMVFDKENVEKLRKSASFGDGEVNNPTRVEAVSAFLWGRFIKAVKAKTGVAKIRSAAVHAVDMRPRADPPLPEHAFGNCCSPTIADFLETDIECQGSSILVNKLRDSIKRIDGEYIKEVQKGNHLSDHSSKIVDLFRQGAEIFGFTSWCRFPVYEVDFGWGRPSWVCTTTLPFKSLVVLMNTRNGDGIEAWVNLVEEDAYMLDDYYEPLSL